MTTYIYTLFAFIYKKRNHTSSIHFCKAQKLHLEWWMGKMYNSQRSSILLQFLLLLLGKKYSHTGKGKMVKWNHCRRHPFSLSLSFFFWFLSDAQNKHHKKAGPEWQDAIKSFLDLRTIKMTVRKRVRSFPFSRLRFSGSWIVWLKSCLRSLLDRDRRVCLFTFFEPKSTL